MNTLNVLKLALDFVERHKTIDGIAVHAALSKAIEQAEQQDTCQMCGDKPYPGCNSEFHGEKACRFWSEQAQPVSDRENSIIQFALHQFMSNAYSHMNAAAQDKDGRRYPPEAVEKFAKDAKDAEALLSRLQFTAPPQRKPWVRLTPDEMPTLTSGLGPITLMPRRETEAFIRVIEAKLKEKNT